jgi:AcrR family transcriptional regulator
MGDHSQDDITQIPTTRPVGRSEVIQATVRAAAELFADKSPSQVTVREIAARAGVSHALVHRYLGSKENIFRHALAYNRDAMAQAHHDCQSGHSVWPFDGQTPQSRYVRTVVRATLDGVSFGREELQPMRAHGGDDTVSVHTKAAAATQSADLPTFDSRIAFTALVAMTVGMAVAEEFCLAQAELEAADRNWMCSEMNRLGYHILGLTIARDAVEPDPEACLS